MVSVIHALITPEVLVQRKDSALVTSVLKLSRFKKNLVNATPAHLVQHQVVTSKVANQAEDGQATTVPTQFLHQLQIVQVTRLSTNTMDATHVHTQLIQMLKEEIVLTIAHIHTFQGAHPMKSGTDILAEAADQTLTQMFQEIHAFHT